MHQLDEYEIYTFRAPLRHFLGTEFLGHHSVTEENVSILEIQIEDSVEFKDFADLLVMLANFIPQQRVEYFVKIRAVERILDKLYVAFDNPGDLTVSEIISRRLDKRLDWSSTIQIVYEIVKSMKFLDTFKIQHKGIHPANIFIHESIIILGLPSPKNLLQETDVESNDIRDLGKLMIRLLSGGDTLKVLSSVPFISEDLISLINCCLDGSIQNMDMLSRDIVTFVIYRDILEP